MKSVTIALFTFITQLLHPAFISPLPDHPVTPVQIPPSSNNHRVVGFLPYWNLKYLDRIDFSHLTELVYFSLPITADGALDSPSLAYRRFVSTNDQLHQLAQTNHLNLTAAITAPDNATLFSLLNNPPAQQRLAQNLSALATQYQLDGLNLDFEPTVATDSATSNGLTQFVNQLKIENWQLKISMDIYPSAAASVKIWDLPALTPNIDHFIAMTYDYYHPGSAEAGPLAPLYLAQASDRHAVMVNLAQLTHVIPHDKVLLGIPFYGYEWATQSDTFLSSPISAGSLASLDRIQSVLSSDVSITKHWDATTLTPWLSFTENGHPKEIYYENSISLAYKKQIVDTADLGGYAVWALGYEGTDSSIWRSLSN